MTDLHAELARLQQRMALQVEVPETGSGRLPGVVWAFDVQYVGDVGHVAAACACTGERPDVYVCQVPARTPYVPGLFCFREGPLLLRLLDELRGRVGLSAPELLLVDGHGIAHPRRFGLACWLGVSSGLPAVGCAKRSLLPLDLAGLAHGRGSVLPVHAESDVVGHAVRRRAGVKPVFASAGHRISKLSAVELTLALPGPYRIPDLQRAADQAARSSAAGDELREVHSLGELVG